MSLAESRRQQEALDPYSYPEIQVDEATGTRTVQCAGDRIRTRPDWFQHQQVNGWPVADVEADGTLQLDTAGEYRYRPVGELPRGFTAYERITA